MAKNVIIKCPNCGYEYTLEEIFYPDDLLGKPVNIIRDDNGKIMFIEGEDPILKESYCCDNCGVEFDAYADIHVFTKCTVPVNDEDDDEFVINLRDEDKEHLF